MIKIPPFAICGDWDTSPTPKDFRRIIMPPLGHVFGAGWHPTTAAALRELPNHIYIGCTFADVGCGAGTLCVAARLLGAGKVYGTEINPEAFEAAKRVIAANQMDIELIRGTYPPEPVDVMVVSIGEEFLKQHGANLRANKLIVINDDATVTIT